MGLAIYKNPRENLFFVNWIRPLAKGFCERNAREPHFMLIIVAMATGAFE